MDNARRVDVFEDAEDLEHEVGDVRLRKRLLAVDYLLQVALHQLGNDI